MIEVPSGFIELCEHFHQDFTVLYGSLESGILEFKQGVSAGENETLALFLEGIANSSSNQELENLWRDCGAQVDVSASYKQFFLQIAGLLRGDTL
jgi:hypothetical protein